MYVYIYTTYKTGNGTAARRRVPKRSFAPRRLKPRDGERLQGTNSHLDDGFLDGSKHRGYADRGMNIHERPLLGPLFAMVN